MVPLRRIKLAIVAKELFDPETGGRDGFGWAALQVARCFNEHPDRGVEVVFVSGEVLGSRGSELVAHDTRLLLRQPTRRESFRALAAEGIDLILCIDYRPDHRSVFWSLPRAPIVVWARDPRTPADAERIETLRIPGPDHIGHRATTPIDCTSLASVVRISRMRGRPVILASEMPHIAEKLPSAYGLSSSLLLPNPDLVDYAAALPPKSAAPRVVFPTTLDPCERPWLLVELARSFPHVEFVVLGPDRFGIPGSWQPDELPANVNLPGHVDGGERARLLASAWALVNTSIHEESPVSMLQALACGTPILSCVEAGGIVSRFGTFVGRFDGTGMEAVPHLAAGLQRFLRDHELRARLGAAGRHWARREHNTTRFLSALDQLCTLAGMRRRVASYQELPAAAGGFA